MAVPPPGANLLPLWDRIPRSGDSRVLRRGSRLPDVMYAAGDRVRIRANGIVGKVYLKLPLSDVYLVQWPGFPLTEKLYYGSDLEPAEGLDGAQHGVLCSGTRQAG
jgi:hypothetical protein